MPRLLRTLILLSQRTLFRAARSPQPFESLRADGDLVAGAAEHDDGARFALRLGGSFSPRALDGKRVLDVGCGYGGRTVYYAERSSLTAIVGLEITDGIVRRCRAFAQQRRCENAVFVTGFAEQLPFESESFDVVLSFDVLEHVRDPAAALSEIARVVRADGDVWLVFPTYLGARSSHLDYITRLPGLHRIFAADVIVDVVNELLAADPDRFQIAHQPAPQVSELGRLTLPLLNGLTRADLPELLDSAGLVARRTVLEPIVTRDTPVPAARLLNICTRLLARGLGWPELLIGSIGLHVAKRPARRGASSAPAAAS
jgi:SAM-dependent methyltransferase